LTRKDQQRFAEWSEKSVGAARFVDVTTVVGVLVPGSGVATLMFAMTEMFPLSNLEPSGLTFLPTWR
jgi:hypothetical protein